MQRNMGGPTTIRGCRPGRDPPPERNTVGFRPLAHPVAIFARWQIVCPPTVEPLCRRESERVPKAWMNSGVARASILICAVLGGEHTARAQTTSTPQDVPPADAQTAIEEGRACLGCPRRSVGKALFQTTIINVFYGLANLMRGQDTAKITPKTWWANMEQGWVWDLDDFTVNQIGHPYQGNNYFNAGRANGLSFYESAAVTAFGSATWEYFGETNHASLNDFINTTLGGIALGEMFHRAAWLVRDTHATGRGRLWNEIGATVDRSGHGREPVHHGRFLAASWTSPPTWCRRSSRPTCRSARCGAATPSRAFEAAGQPFLEVDCCTATARADAAGRRTTPSPCGCASAAGRRSARPGSAAGCSASR